MQPQEILIETFPSTTVHDLCFDWYGNRLAACTSDRKIKIFLKQNSKWRLQYDFFAHEDITHKVKWAHPDFGSIIASCSFDKTVIIWEEPKTNILMNQPEIIENSDRPWIIRAKLSDSKESIEDIKFGPKHRGLILCTAATEGVFRIYEAPDIMNLGAWKLTNEVEVSSFGISAIIRLKTIII